MIKTADLSISVGERRLISRLNWQVNSGECWCIIGRNGAGKTTLLRHLAGLVNVKSGSGEILIMDQLLQKWALSDLAKIRAYLPQDRHDAFAYSVIETVLGARHPFNDGRYWESAEDLAAAYSALSELDVADLAQRDVRCLSGGERQRVAIAALLTQDAPLMLLDEPTRSLDLAHQIAAMHLFAERCKDSNKAIVMVSHDLNLAYRYATHVLLIMSDGPCLAGSVKETMTGSALSRCLGHPIDMIWHEEKCVFLPT